MGNESWEERRAAEEKARGKALHIYHQYHRKKPRKNINSSHNTPHHTDEPPATAAVGSYPFWSPTPPPQVAAADTHAYAPAATGASSNPTPPSFLSCSIPGPVPSRPEPGTGRNDGNHQGHHSSPYLTAAITRNKTPRAKVYPSVLVPPSFSSSPPPLGDDISLMELLASGEDEGDAERARTAPPSGNNVKFMDMVGTMDGGGEKGKKKEEEGRKNNKFVKMLMEEEGAVDEEELMKEVKEELLMREVDAYACLLRNPAADIDLKDLFGGSSSL